MATGWAKEGAVQEQIDASIESAVERARSRIPVGESLLLCADCEEPIPEARRQAVPGVRYCVKCQAEHDAEDAQTAMFNRRGSKDSQLK